MLIDLLMSGKFDLVRKVLTHIAKCILEFNTRRESKTDQDEDCFITGDSIERLVIPSIIIKRMLREVIQSDYYLLNSAE
jgi:hypothetical protein